MTYLDYSAFDPIFWLHHCMIDRIFAMWQVIYNASYVEPFNSVEQTYTIALGQLLDVNSRTSNLIHDLHSLIFTSIEPISLRCYRDVVDVDQCKIYQNIRLYLRRFREWKHCRSQDSSQPPLRE